MVTYPAGHSALCPTNGVETKRCGYKVPFVPKREFFKKLMVEDLLLFGSGSVVGKTAGFGVRALSSNPGWTAG